METSQDEGQDQVEPVTGHHRVPHVARARSNLTVLSQHYNASHCLAGCCPDWSFCLNAEANMAS
jgi:hypothetical protein